MKYVYSFLVLFVPWLVLSGKFDPVHVGMGVLCSLLVGYWCADLLFQDRATTLGNRLRQLIGFVGYMGWLLGQIIVANLHVFRVALSPRMNELLSPQMVEFDSKLEKEFSKFILANSITLTPGTVTVRVEGSRFLVHSLTAKLAEGLPGVMEKRIANIFEKTR
ncbi:MAG: multicomponent Na+:H+ antiporter subunit E [Limisphaerales bacterium]|jgi:multicomponent Na+:H+ antiporter subunit E